MPERRTKTQSKLEAKIFERQQVLNQIKLLNKKSVKLLQVIDGLFEQNAREQEAEDKRRPNRWKQGAK